jgi:hypothetical protein
MKHIHVIFKSEIPKIGKYIKSASNYINQLIDSKTGKLINVEKEEIEKEKIIKFDKKFIINTGTKVEIPFWLASLCGKQNFVECEVPREFQDLNYVQSNYEKASVSQLNFYFYVF